MCFYIKVRKKNFLELSFTTVSWVCSNRDRDRLRWWKLSFLRPCYCPSKAIFGMIAVDSRRSGYLLTTLETLTYLQYRGQRGPQSTTHPSGMFRCSDSFRRNVFPNFMCSTLRRAATWHFEDKARTNQQESFSWRRRWPAIPARKTTTKHRQQERLM